MAYRNHSSADKHASEVWQRVVADVKTGRAMVFPARLVGLVRGLPVNPVGVVEGKGKSRIIHDSTFDGDPEGEEGGGRPENETTHWDQIPECHLADVMLQIVRRILG